MEKTLELKGMEIASMKKKDKFKLEEFELSPIIKDISPKDKVKIKSDDGISEWLCFKKSSKGLELISISYIPGMIMSLNIAERNSTTNLQYNMYSKFLDGNNYYSRMHLLTGGASSIIHLARMQLRG